MIVVQPIVSAQKQKRASTKAPKVTIGGVKRSTFNYDKTMEQHMCLRPFDLTELETLFQSAPFGSTGAHLYKYEYMSQEYMSKYNPIGLTDVISLRDNAIHKMLESEATCREINQHGYRPHILDGWFNGVMHYAQRFVADVLGDIDYSMFDRSAFSGGASTSRKRRNADPYSKYGSAPACDVTWKAAPYARALIKCTPLWDRALKGRLFNITTGNRITTVPKNTETDRAIAMEPDLNMCLQLAVGKHIRSRLLSHGIDLKNQGTNQKLAKEGSITNLLATIDLKSASDSISHRLVLDLVPNDWFNLLDALRSPTGILPEVSLKPNGQQVVWEKFSSMGNGFTFELETLLFASLLFGVNTINGLSTDFGKTDAVYGDDIICRSSIAQNLIGVLDCVGFKTNTKKTFTTGPFRESCGKHYYEGVDITPFYIKREVISLPDKCRLVNRLRQWAYDESQGICDDQVYPTWRHYAKQIPQRLHGGSYTDRTDYVVSPAKSRDRIKTYTKQIEIRGYRSILRWFQSQTLESASNWIDSLTQREAGRLSYLSVTVPGIGYEPNTEEWLPSQLFSKEVVGRAD